MLQGAELVGVRCRLGRQNEWYDAEVLSYDAASAKHKVKYTDPDPEDGSVLEEDEELAVDGYGKGVAEG